MAQEVLDKAISLGKLTRKNCRTENLKLFGYSKESKLAQLSIYGSEAIEIKKIIEKNPFLGIPISNRLPYCQAELMWIIKNEMPRTVEDILARRTRALNLDVQASVELAPMVASLLARELLFDENWEKSQIKKFTDVAHIYMNKSLNPS